MKGYAALMKLSAVNLRASLRGSLRREDGRLNVSIIAVMILSLLGMGVLVGMVVYAQVALTTLLARMGQAALMPAVMLLISLVCTLLMGAFGTMSRLYFSRDTAWLASLPLTSRTVFAARVTELWLGEVLLDLLLLAPTLITFDVHTAPDIGYWFRALAVVLLCSCLPLAVNVALSTLLARCTALMRHKELMTILVSVVMFALLLLVEFTVLPKIPADAGALYFVQLLISRSGLLTLLTSALPPLRWAMDGLRGNWGALLLFVLSTLGVLAMLVTLLGGGYVRTCIHQDEQSTARKQRHDAAKATASASPLRALCLRDGRELIRTPAYLINACSMVIVMPLMAVFMVAGMSSEVSVGEMLSVLHGLIGRISCTDLLLIVTAVCTFGCLINPVIATAVSREGKHHDLYRMLPLSPALLMKSKLLLGGALGMVSSLVTAVMAALLLGERWWIMPMAWMLANVFNLGACSVMLTIDAVHPDYHWANETQAIKQNINTLWAMLAGFMMMLLPAGAWALLRFVLHGSAGVVLVGVAAVLIGETAAGCMLLHRVGVRAYSRSEG